MRRRRYLALLGLGGLAGCTGGPGDAITSLAVNRDGVAHTVAVSVVRDDRRVIDGEVEVAAEDPFNQLDVVVEDGEADLNRGLAA